MGVLKKKKKRGTTTNQRRKIDYYRLKYIPKEILTEILLQVASASLIDLVNAKISCKKFLEASTEDYFYKYVSLSSIPIIPWKIGVSSFLDKCKKSGNPEALFRQGMIDYFGKLKPADSGLELLKNAADKGHVEANYVYGVIMACYGGEWRKEGLNLLSNKFKRSNLSLVITECRKNVQNIFPYFWVKTFNVGMDLRRRIKNERWTCICKKKALGSLSTVRRSGWTMDDDEFEDNTALCDSCLWYVEAIQFCNMLKNGGHYGPRLYTID